MGPEIAKEYVRMAIIPQPQQMPGARFARSPAIPPTRRIPGKIPKETSLSFVALIVPEFQGSPGDYRANDRRNNVAHQTRT